MRNWFKSSYSSNNSDNCIEVCVRERHVAIRDSKDRAGPRLWQDSSGWARFLAAVRAGRFEG
ncbi:DUF397 domain-containing protein [Salinifilum ghardaiensis]